MSRVQTTTPAPIQGLLWLAGALFVVLTLAFGTYVWSEREVDRAFEQQRLSLQLCDELRDSSDDLTRMARTYLVTADPLYRQTYDAILAMRDGRLPRPPHFDSIHWDSQSLQAMLTNPAPDAIALPLLERMRQLEFSSTELQQLANAKQLSDTLSATERHAMALIDQTSAAGRAATQARAVALLYDAAYHQAKAAIMAPIGAAALSVERRSADLIAQAQQRTRLFRWVFALVVLGLFGVVFTALRRLVRTLGGSADAVYQHIARIGRGDFSTDIVVPPQARHSVLGWLAHTQTQLRLWQAQAEHERLELAESEQRLQSIIEAEPACIKVIDPEGRLLHMNPSGLAMIEADALDQVQGHSVFDLILPEYRDAFSELHHWVLAGQKGELEFEIQGLRGTRRWVHTHAVAMSYAGRQVHLAVTSDITERKHSENQIQQLAFFDTLTGLPNRHLLMDRLSQTLANLKRQQVHAALLMLDLDNFKSINDTLGHLVGDQVLVEVANRLRTAVREGDTVARFGGDEFILILSGLEPTGMAALQAEAVICKLLDRLRAPIPLNLERSDVNAAQQTYYCSASVGVALMADDTLSITELLKRADTAMYQAKLAGRNALRFFDAHVQAQLSERTHLEAQLREALRAGEFELYYQPQVDAQGLPTGAEALVRWNHPQRGFMTPGHFIALAEKSGLILGLGQWVLEQACGQLARWAALPKYAHLTLSVNVSALQFRQADFVAQVTHCLQRHQVDPHRLKLELTESMLIDDVEDIVSKMTALQQQGVGFALDDFGTGYSSLSQLKRLPLNQLKIDQSFVRHINTDAHDASIAQMVLALAHSLALGVIAEGVEQQEQADYLQRLGCRAYQGYLYGRPMSQDALQDWIEDKLP